MQSTACPDLVSAQPNHPALDALPHPSQLHLLNEKHLHPALAALIRSSILPPSLASLAQLYLPNEEHPSYGVVRTYVKDYDDVPATMGAATWLDSGAWASG